MRLFGFNFGDDSQFRFVQDAADRGADCDNFPFSVTANVIPPFLSLLSAIFVSNSSLEANDTCLKL